jgi:hypothetical protein
MTRVVTLGASLVTHDVGATAVSETTADGS